MKTKFLLIYFLFSGIILFGQNYRSFNSSRTSMFKNDLNEIQYSIHIDSIKFVNGDSVYFPAKNITLLKNCYNVQSSWIGKKVAIKSNGDEIYTTAYDSTILIKPFAKLNDNWTAYSNSNGQYLKASVIQFDTLSFLNVIDSVKTIEILKYNINNQPLYTVCILKLSKNYGAVMFSDLYNFENDQLSQFTLSGLSNTNLGVQNLTWKEVHNYEIGDELHSEEIITNYNNTEIRREAKTIINKNTNGDTTIYEIEVKNLNLYKNAITYKNKDTILFKVYSDSLFDKYPGQTVVKNNSNPANTFEYLMQSNIESSYYFSNINSYPVGRVKIIPSANETYNSVDSDSCINGVTWDGCEQRGHYIEGLGGPYYGTAFNCNMFSDGSHYLIYYKKGNDIWGTPMNMTSSEEISAEQIELTIFPNPASEETTFSSTNFGENAIFQLFDSQGKLIEAHNISSSHFNYKNEKSLQGIYFYTISSEKGKANGKIIFN